MRTMDVYQERRRARPAGRRLGRCCRIRVMCRLLAMIAIVLGGSASFEALQRPADVARWSVKAPPGFVAPAGRFLVELTADVEPGWHLYATTQPEGGPQPLLVAAAKSSRLFDVRAREITGPPPKIAFDPNFRLETHYYDEKATLSVPIEMKFGAAGKHALPLEVTYQVCSDRVCLRPVTDIVMVDVDVSSSTRRRKGLRR